MTSTPIHHSTIGQEMYRLLVELFPICRSITGNGVRQTLAAIKAHIPLELHEVPTSTKVFDWEVPREWNIREAFIMDEKGTRVVDFKYHTSLDNLDLVTPEDCWEASSYLQIASSCSNRTSGSGSPAWENRSLENGGSIPTSAPRTPEGLSET